jgi:hypothetical protein
MERKTKAATETGVYLLIVGAILVFANLISFSVYKRFDTTRNERFTLSKGSARLVHDGLKQDLSVEVYVTRGTPKQEAFIQDLTDLIGEYERASGGKLHYTVIEAKTDEQKAAAKEAGLQEAAFGEGNETGQDQVSISRGYMGIAFKYGSEKEAIPILSPDQTQGLEFWVTNKIREIRDRADDIHQEFGVIIGKDEIKLSEPNLIPSQPGRGQGPNMKSILEQALPFYKLKDVDLQGGEAEIDKSLAGLIITQPGKEYTEKELRRIDQFLMLGNKALTVFAGAVNIKANDASMKATLNTWGLEKLLEGYGIEMKKEAILDWGRSISIPFQTQDGQMAWFRDPGIVQALHDPDRDEKEQFLDSSFAGFFRLEELGFPFPSTLVAHPDKQPEAVMKVIARSTARSTIDTADTIDMKIRADWAPKGERGQRAMAIELEGKLKSAYGGQEALGISTPAESKDKSRVLVVASSQFLANPFARAGNGPPMPPQMAMMGGNMGGDEMLLGLSQPYAQKYLTSTILGFKNILDWMGGDSDLIAASAKLLGETNLAYSDVNKSKSDDASDDPADMERKAKDFKLEREHVQQRVQWTLILFAPALFAAFGVLRWKLRESARSTISLD